MGKMVLEKEQSFDSFTGKRTVTSFYQLRAPLSTDVPVLSLNLSDK